MIVFALLNRTIAGLLRIASIAAAVCGPASLALIFLSIWASGSGGPAFAWLRRATRQDELVLAFAYPLFRAFGYAAAAAVALMIARWLLNRVLLLSTTPAEGVVVTVRQSHVSIDREPVMMFAIDCAIGGIRRRTYARQLCDLGNIPRAGDRVRLAVSRLDPAFARIIGYA